MVLMAQQKPSSAAPPQAKVRHPDRYLEKAKQKYSSGNLAELSIELRRVSKNVPEAPIGSPKDRIDQEIQHQTEITVTRAPPQGTVPEASETEGRQTQANHQHHWICKA